MNLTLHTHQLFAFSIYFSTLAIYVESDSNETLHSDHENRGLVNIIKKKVENGRKSIKHESAIVCPALSPHEMEFNSKRSLGKNCLFVKDTYAETQSPSSISQDICDHVYKMSMSYHRRSYEIFFGYEVYYDSEKYYRLNNEFNYVDFEPVEKAYSKTNNMESSLETRSKPKLELKQDSGEPITLGFLWILQFRLKFDNSRKGPEQVTYRLSSSTEIGASCDNYNLGKEVYEQKEIDYVDSLYKNQVNIFKGVEIPELDYGCEKENECLTKYSLVPAEKFRFYSPEPKSTSCSNLTMVPIWNRTTPGILQKLDKFLFALVKFTYGGLNVVSGVHGHLEMSKKGLEGTAEISLGNEGDIPVPNIIYKIVKYEYKLRKKLEEGGYKRTHEGEGVIIVVHNHPQFDRAKDALCSKVENNCENWGWSEILYEGTSSSGESPSNNIYCCPINSGIMDKLGRLYERESFKVLNLKKFAAYDKITLKERIENIQQEVLNEMNMMFGKKPIPEGVTKDESVVEN